MIPNIISYHPDLLLEAIQLFPDKVPVGVVDLFFSAKGIDPPRIACGTDLFVNENRYVEACLAQKVTPFAVKKYTFRDGNFIEITKNTDHFAPGVMGSESLEAKARGEAEGHPPSVVHVECWDHLAEAKKDIIPKLVADQYRLTDGYVMAGNGNIKLRSRTTNMVTIRIVDFDGIGSYSDQEKILAAGSSDHPLWNWYFNLQRRLDCASGPFM